MKKLILISIIYILNNLYCSAEQQNSIFIYTDSTLSKEEINKIINITNSQQPQDSGYIATFYKIDDYAVIKSKTTTSKLYDFYSLQYLNKKHINNVPTSLAAFKNNNYNYIISSYFDGNDLNKNDMYLDKIIDEILKTLLNFDINLFFHRDLHAKNIMFNKKNFKIQIIDFDSSTIINNIGIETKVTENYKTEYCQNTQNCLKKYVNKKNNDNEHINTPFIDNPFLLIDSNIDNFEYKYLSTYITILERRDDFELFFKNYLNKKSNYLEKRYKIYKKSKKIFSKTQASKDYKLGLEIEKATSNLLKNPSKNIYDIELIKLKIKGLYLNKKEYKNLSEIYFRQLKEKLTEFKSTHKTRETELYIFSIENWINKWEDYKINQ